MRYPKVMEMEHAKGMEKLQKIIKYGKNIEKKIFTQVVLSYFRLIPGTVSPRIVQIQTVRL